MCPLLPCQEQLGLELGQRFQSRWVSQQWRSWQAIMQALGLPASGFQEGSNVQRPCMRELGLEAWSVSTLLLLALLVHWSGSLKQERARGAALRLLGGILQAGLPGQWPMLLSLSSWSSAEWWGAASVSACEVLVPVENGMVQCRALLERMPSLRKAELRSHACATVLSSPLDEVEQAVMPDLEFELGLNLTLS